MVMAMQFVATGGPEVLRATQLTVGSPPAHHVRLRHTAVGVNYIDVYHRSGLYPVPLPNVPGLEAAGIIEEIGPEVTGLSVGQRVVYGRGPLGAYAEQRVIMGKECIPIPDGVSDETAACAMLKGLTAWYLLHQTFPVAKGDTLLIHAAAGGVGLILSQWAKKLGARVIGTAGSTEKAELALHYGCDEVILYRQEEVAPRVRELTKGRGVDVVYDAVGKTTFTASLDSLKPLGMLVSYGQASGEIPPFDLRELSKRGSLFVTRPSLVDYMRHDAVYQQAATELLKRVASGELRINVAQRFALKDAAEAHRSLEARKTVGSTVLLP